MLDVLARTALWDAGLDYLHGTGHGVGAFLNVHEGLCAILFTCFYSQGSKLIPQIQMPIVEVKM